ncbi:methylmalonyl Co-A mutase-associated GTPase MeaB [Rufibacter latericius]|uniref:Methylmalonyl Co-A mutase-associated GTPase MeaB n=1 Tax=Rufibacter latericius TaxID=2487040 RepID=A0A3M9N058_9BACT|nr:methylmalonyl Co-A mutase-associated GTPase MeaB [Rufibacter latericius]RNI31174.1 methylmalonyl Co-A mutase-associated GTPase MeaB [Rufibacter latericius]
MPKRFTPDEYAAGVLSGNRVLLSRAITLVESTLLSDQELAHQVMEQVLPHAGKSVRVGITGVPGVGKSTFIEAFGNHLLEQHGKKLAVLAIDPTSQRTGGSILGDKTRMETLSSNPNAYIRPSPAGKTLGGVARSTRESILLCEAAGFDVIFVETVGVGQSETAVHEMVDFFLLLMLAGAGDELQGIKKGIMEMADAIAITKADGTNLHPATSAQAEYQGALHLFPLGPSKWSPKVSVCSAFEKTGLGTIWESVTEYVQLTQQNGYFQKRRQEQNMHWLKHSIRQQLEERFYQHPAVQAQWTAISGQVTQGQKSPFAAAAELFGLLP